MKDLYAILECSPTDSQLVIKRKYRKLAQQYHPDKNPNDKYAAAKFQEIKEAYEILTSPQKKDIWLQERWLHKVMNQTTFETEPLTPQTILFKILQWEKEMYLTDSFRMNIIQCEKKLNIFLSQEYITCILSFNDPEIHEQIVIHLLRALDWLPYSIIEKHQISLLELVKDSKSNEQLMHLFLRKKRKEKLWDQWKFPIIVIATALICFFIMKIGR